MYYGLRDAVAMHAYEQLLALGHDAVRETGHITAQLLLGNRWCILLSLSGWFWTSLGIWTCNRQRSRQQTQRLATGIAARASVFRATLAFIVAR